MKKFIITCFTVVCFTGLYSQANLRFCTGVEQTGNCIFENTKFITSPDSTEQKIQMELFSRFPFGTQNVIFKIYSLSPKGEEKLIDLVSQKIEPEWFLAWSPYTFKSPGKYTVKVYSAEDKLMTSSSFELIAFY